VDGRATPQACPERSRRVQPGEDARLSIGKVAERSNHNSIHSEGPARRREAWNRPRCYRRSIISPKAVSRATFEAGLQSLGFVTCVLAPRLDKL